MILNHLAIQCADVSASSQFYDQVLPTVGGHRVLEHDGVIGYGDGAEPHFLIGAQQSGEGFRETHVAFAAPDRAAVHAFRDAAVAAGAEVLNEPRVWTEYAPTYYAVFVRDPDGNNVEAVTFAA